MCNVYLWLDSTRPFYVGLGSYQRAKCRKHNKQAEGRRKLAEEKGTFKIEIVFSGSRKGCEMVETHLIASYGSITSGGLLLNFTKGGDGLRGKENLPDDSLKRMSNGGKKGGKNKRTSKKWFIAGGTSQGKKNVESGHIQKLAEHNSKEYMFIDPQGEPILIRNLSRFCKENNLSLGNMQGVLYGTRSHHKGYRRHEH